MPGRKCKGCGGQYTSSDKRRKFCCLDCCWGWRRSHKEELEGTFRPGLIPWNTGTVGVMKPNSRSFKAGRSSDKKQLVGSVVFRRDKQGGVRAWIKVQENGDSYDWVLRAVYNWERRYGPIPRGSVVHHRDRNKTNDIVGNLELLTRAEHLLEHRQESEEKRKHAASDATRRRHATNRANR